MEIDTNTLCLNTLAQDSFLQVNTSLLDFLDGDSNSVLILSSLISQYKFYKSQDMIDSNGYFYCTIEHLYKRTRIKESSQRASLRNLQTIYGLLKVKVSGMPAKRFIKLDFEAITKVLSGQNPVVAKPDKKVFYQQLNEGIDLGWDIYKVRIDNLNPSTALILYFWKKFINTKKGFWYWNPTNTSIINSWVKSELRTGPIDFRFIYDFLVSLDIEKITPDEIVLIVKKFHFWQKGIPDRSPSERITDGKKFLELLN